MDLPTIYVTLAILVLASFALLTRLSNWKTISSEKRSPLTYIAVGLVILSMVFESGIVAYPLLGIAMVLVAVGFVRRKKQEN